LLSKQSSEICVQDPVYIRALEKALRLKGGAEGLAAHIGAPVGYVRLWERGAAPIPADVFLKVVDLLFSDEAAQAGGE